MLLHQASTGRDQNMLSQMRLRCRCWRPLPQRSQHIKFELVVTAQMLWHQSDITWATACKLQQLMKTVQMMLHQASTRWDQYMLSQLWLRCCCWRPRPQRSQHACPQLLEHNADTVASNNSVSQATACVRPAVEHSAVAVASRNSVLQATACMPPAAEHAAARIK